MMKKKLLVLSLLLTSCCLMAFKLLTPTDVGCKSEDNSASFNQEVLIDFLKYPAFEDREELLYKVDSRFLTTISKSDLDKAESIIDILPKKATEMIDEYYYSRVSILNDHIETDQRAIANNEVLTTKQMNLLQSTDDSGNIYIRSDYRNKSEFRNDSYLTYFISVVPDHQAHYKDGYAALIDYLKKQSEEDVRIITKEGLKAGKIRFTISKEGFIKGITLSSTSGYESVDDALVEAIENIPGEWVPASNQLGENVDQEFVFFFGIEGC